MKSSFFVSQNESLQVKRLIDVYISRIDFEYAAKYSKGLQREWSVTRGRLNFSICMSKYPALTPFLSKSTTKAGLMCVKHVFMH